MADLQVALATPGQAGRIWSLQHVMAVLGLLDAQADAEAGIRPDLVVHGRTGLLGGQDQVQSHAPADASRAYQLVDEIGPLRLQLGELVHHQHQVR